MSLMRPVPVPYDALAWVKRPFAERARMVCEAWALQGYGTPPAIYLLHVLKIGVYVGVWVVLCGFTPGMGGLTTIADWAFTPIAFQKAIVWSMVFEGLGLGCGFGPLTGHYFPPMGGVLHFLRPGTTKAATLPRAPIIGGTRRTWLDVALYAALLVVSFRALIAPAIDRSMWLPIVVLVPAVGLTDRTIFLALRAEHYWTTAVCFAVTGDWIAGAKAVQIALWFWAGFSKLNHHFPTVVCVMTSNSPVIRFAWFRRRMYRDFPRDLRPSRLAVAMSHVGTALELSVPILFLLSPGGSSLAVGFVLMLVLHTFITSNVPLGVPIEWNVMVVYGAFALFWRHPEARVGDLLAISPGLAAFLAVMLVAAPLFGNLVPARLSFLLAMRFYAGNWPYGVWLFRGDSYQKLAKLTKSAPWVYDQLDRFYDRTTSIGLVGKVMGFRLMHLQGRALPVLIPKAVDRLEDYEYLDGELVAGLVLGWNFGDGHLHREPLLAAVQEQCGFEPGELRCIFVEGQPFGRSTMAYRIHDAATGLIEAGTLDVRAMRQRQPWMADDGTLNVS
ncbi:MAG TPA: DUF3556 domain-containing protein [Kofleriaceae bacterium]|nr:DUF3556 domain-containing protein [Kofleriaceae bacterium]